MSITRNFDLYLTAGKSIPLVVNANQYDQGEEWIFTLYSSNGVKYTPSSGSIVGIKADGNLIANAGTVNGSGQVVITETQQMTAAAGKAIYELSIDGGTHGTANFIVMVEQSPTEGGTASQSDVSLMEEAIEAAGEIGNVAELEAYIEDLEDEIDAIRVAVGSPLVASTAADMTDEDKIYVYVGSETGYTSGNWYYYDGDSWESGGVYNSVAVQTDDTLSVQGAAADAKKVGDEITDLKSAIQQGGSFTSEVKDALETLLSKVAYVDGNGQTYLDALHNAMYRPATLVSISAVYTQSGTVYTFDSLESLEDDLVVTAHYDDYSSRVVTNYTLSGTLTAGTSTITVSYGGKTATFDVVAETRQMQISSMVTGVMTWAANTGLRYAHATPSRMVMNPCAFPMVKGRTYTLSLGSQWGTYLAGIRVVAGNTTGLDFSIDSSVDKNWTALNESILDDGNQSSDYAYVATEDDSVFTVSIKKPDTTNMTSADLAAVLAEITLVES